MGKLNPKRIYVNMKELVSDFTYRDFIYFIYNLGMDYYNGLNLLQKDEWQTIFSALKDNYTHYEIEKKINYREFHARMATVINEVLYKHEHLYEIMTDALSSFGKGNPAAKLKYVIMDLDEQETIAQELASRS